MKITANQPINDQSVLWKVCSAGFIGCGNCDASGDHWIQSQRRRWSMPSFFVASTTVMYCWRAHRIEEMSAPDTAASRLPCWNSLSDDLRDLTLSTPLTVSDICLKLGCFQSTSTHIALEVTHFMRYINSRPTY